MDCTTCFWLSPQATHALTLTRNADGVFEDGAPVALMGRRFRHAWLDYTWILAFTDGTQSAPERLIQITDTVDDDWPAPLRRRLHRAAADMVGVPAEYVTVHVADLECPLHGSYASTGPNLAFAQPYYTSYGDGALASRQPTPPKIDLTPDPYRLWTLCRDGVRAPNFCTGF
jgi:hypothetical protein